MDISIKTLEEAQDVSIIHHIFSNGKALPSPDKPLFVVVVGAPGVGKTSQVMKFLKKDGTSYDSFYHVSLDSIVERVKPYRIATKLLYDEMKKKQELTDEDYAILNEVYLATIMSTDIGFDLNYTVHRILNKIEKRDKRKKEAKSHSELQSLYEMRGEGLQEGIDRGYNIIYDTTFSSKRNVMKEDIMPLLEASPIKYQIHVMLVEASKEQIKKQLARRHKNMIKEKYIRAMPPKLTGKFIEENRTGFEIAETYFTSGKYQSNVKKSKYSPLQFVFQRVANRFNPPISSMEVDQIEKDSPKRSSTRKKSHRSHKSHQSIKNKIRS